MKARDVLQKDGDVVGCERLMVNKKEGKRKRRRGWNAGELVYLLGCGPALVY